jgi:hypothetical protein
LTVNPFALLRLPISSAPWFPISRAQTPLRLHPLSSPMHLTGVRCAFAGQLVGNAVALRVDEACPGPGVGSRRGQGGAPLRHHRAGVTVGSQATLGGGIAPLRLYFGRSSAGRRRPGPASCACTQADNANQPERASHRSCVKGRPVGARLRPVAPSAPAALRNPAGFSRRRSLALNPLRFEGG